jgi:hypothetical protein
VVPRSVAKLLAKPTDALLAAFVFPVTIDRKQMS